MSILMLVSLALAGTSGAQPLRTVHGDLSSRISGLRRATCCQSFDCITGRSVNPCGAQFETPSFAGQLFVTGGLLDASRDFLIMPDAIGFGQSSKPSDGLRARFPRYGYVDIVTAQYRLLTEGLRVNHLRLVMGTSMGAMHT